MDCSVTYVLPKMAVFADEQPLGLHLQFEPLNRLDHGLGREQLAGRTAEAVQFPSGRVGAEGHLLLGGSLGHAELVVAAHGDGHGTHCTKRNIFIDL